MPTYDQLQAVADKEDSALQAAEQFRSGGTGIQDRIEQRAKQILDEDLNLVDRRNQAEDYFFSLSQGETNVEQFAEGKNINPAQTISLRGDQLDQAYGNIRNVVEQQAKRGQTVAQIGKQGVDEFNNRLEGLKFVAESANKEYERMVQLKQLENEEARIAEQKRQFGITESRLRDAESFSQKIQTLDALTQEQTDFFGNASSNKAQLADALGLSVTRGDVSNLPTDNLNPFNVKLVSLAKNNRLPTEGYKTDSQGHIIFDTPEQGLQVGLQVIGKIVEENPGITIGQLGWASDKSWNQKVSQFLSEASGGKYNANSKIEDIPADLLSQAIARQEGYSGEISASQEQGSVQKSLKQFAAEDFSRAKAAGKGEEYLASLNQPQQPQPTQVAQGPDISQVQDEASARQYLQSGGSPRELLLKAQNDVARENIKRLIETETGVRVLEGKEAFDAELKLADTADKLGKEAIDARRQLNQMESGLAAAEASFGEKDDLGKIDGISENGAIVGSLNAPAQAILVTFQKILDPTSVVRESEYARSGSGLSLIGRIEGGIDTLAKGGAGVTLKDLRDFVVLAQEFYKGYEGTQRDQLQRTVSQADNAALNIDNILTPENLSLLEESEQQPAQPQATFSASSGKSFNLPYS